MHSGRPDHWKEMVLIWLIRVIISSIKQVPISQRRPVIMPLNNIGMCKNPGYPLGSVWEHFEKLRLISPRCIEVLYFQSFHRCCSWNSNISYDVMNRKEASAIEDCNTPCPFSKTLSRSILTRSNVCPWDLWIDIAQANINGTCILWTSMLPTGPGTVNSVAGKTRSSSLVNLTIGHSCWRPKM